MRGRARNAPLVTALVAALVALGLVVIDARVHPLPGLASLEGFSIDARFAIRGPREPASDRVVIVGMDDRTRGLAPELFQTRRGYALLIDKLTAYDPKVIALDVFFESPEEILPPALADRVRATAGHLHDLADGRSTQTPVDPALVESADVLAQVADALRGDELLGDAITRSHRVVLGAHFALGGRARATEPLGLAAARHGETADANGGGDRRPASARAVTFTRADIARGAIGAGAVNAYRDLDGSCAVFRWRSNTRSATTCRSGLPSR